MSDAPSTDWPPEVQAKLARVAEVSRDIDSTSRRLDDLYEERMDLYLELRALDPPVPYKVIGDATGTQEAAVRIGIAKELARCEKLGRKDVAPEQELGRRGRGVTRIAIAQAIRAREREQRQTSNGAGQPQRRSPRRA